MRSVHDTVACESPATARTLLTTNGDGTTVTEVQACVVDSPNALNDATRMLVEV